MSKYIFHKTSILDPHHVRDYVSDDGMYAIIPVIGDKQWAVIVNGQQTEKYYRKFDTAMKDVLKLQNSNKKKTKKK